MAFVDAVAVDESAADVTVDDATADAEEISEEGEPAAGSDESVFFLIRFGIRQNVCDFA